MEHLKDFIYKNSHQLFKTTEGLKYEAVFDNRGFFFEPNTEEIYKMIRNAPHLYVAWTKDPKGYVYIGKSLQKGGRWKRSHAYHMGTLAHHLLGQTRSDDQNHEHWIDHWMDRSSVKISNEGLHTIGLKHEVYISFIPYELYSEFFTNEEIPSNPRAVNTIAEKMLIQAYRSGGDGVILLNVLK
jgi:hypothetical protein